MEDSQDIYGDKPYNELNMNTFHRSLSAKEEINEEFWSPELKDLISETELPNLDLLPKKSDEIFEAPTHNNIVSNEINIQNSVIRIRSAPKNNMKSKFTITTYTTKKKGRRKNGSIEKGGHTKGAEDNQTRKCWRDFMDAILNLVNYYSTPDKISPTNFIQQFGSCINKNTEFLGLTIKEYFTYNTKFDDDKNHKEIGNKNSKIINKMKNNQIYMAIMNSTIEDMFSKFIKNEKIIIIKGKKYSLSNFKTIDDNIKEKRKVLLKKKELTVDTIDKELNTYKHKFMNLVDYIKNEGPKIKRK